MVTPLLLLVCLPIIYASTTFAAVSHLDTDCLPALLTYLIFTSVCCTAICSIATFFVAIFQTADYLYVRVAYYRHHPQYRNHEVAALLCLSWKFLFSVLSSFTKSWPTATSTGPPSSCAATQQKPLPFGCTPLFLFWFSLPPFWDYKFTAAFTWAGCILPTTYPDFLVSYYSPRRPHQLLYSALHQLLATFILTLKMSDQLEIDGQRTEQLILARRKLKQQNQELFNLQALHQCKKGLFCLVKQAELCYDVTQQGHELSYTLNKQRQSFMTMVGVKPIKGLSNPAQLREAFFVSAPILNACTLW